MGGKPRQHNSPSTISADVNAANKSSDTRADYEDCTPALSNANAEGDPPTNNLLQKLDSDFAEEFRTPPSGSSRRLSENPDVIEAYQYQNQSFHSLALVPKDADDFHDNQEMENNKKWKRLSARIDNTARTWIPLTFIVAMAVIFAELGTI